MTKTADLHAMYSFELTVSRVDPALAQGKAHASSSEASWPRQERSAPLLANSVSSLQVSTASSPATSATGMRASRRRQLRPQGALTYHAWVAEQDTKVLSSDGTCAFFLDRPLKAGRLDADWNYKLQLGNKSGGSGGITIITISRQWALPPLSSVLVLAKHCWRWGLSVVVPGSLSDPLVLTALKNGRETTNHEQSSQQGGSDSCCVQGCKRRRLTLQSH